MNDEKTTQAFLTFRIGREWYGIDVMTVIEVLQMVTLNLLPGEEAIGMMTLRDQVMPVVDLRQTFGIAKPTYTLETPIIAVSGEHTAFGLIVDEADDVAFVDCATITPYNHAIIASTARHDDTVLFILDIQTLTPVNHHG